MPIQHFESYSPTMLPLATLAKIVILAPWLLLNPLVAYAAPIQGAGLKPSVFPALTQKGQCPAPEVIYQMFDDGSKLILSVSKSDIDKAYKKTNVDNGDADTPEDFKLQYLARQVFESRQPGLPSRPGLPNLHLIGGTNFGPIDDKVSKDNKAPLVPELRRIAGAVGKPSEITQETNPGKNHEDNDEKSWKDFSAFSADHSSSGGGGDSHGRPSNSGTILANNNGENIKSRYTKTNAAPGDGGDKLDMSLGHVQQKVTDHEHPLPGSAFVTKLRPVAKAIPKLSLYLVAPPQLPVEANGNLYSASSYPTEEYLPPLE